MFAGKDITQFLTARAYTIGGQQIPEWFVWGAAAIGILLLFKLFFSGGSDKKDARKRQAWQARQEEEYAPLIAAMQPLISLQEDLNERLKRLMERELKTATKELKRERLESDLTQFTQSRYSKLNSWHLNLFEKDGFMPVIRIRTTGGYECPHGALGAVEYEDTEKWERGFRYLFKNVPVADHENNRDYALFSLEDAKRFMEQCFVVAVSELPFGFTPEMLGLQDGPKPIDLVRANPAGSASTWHFAKP